MQKNCFWGLRTIRPHQIISWLTLLCQLLAGESKAQGNLVNNPSFEMNCGGYSAPYWQGLDSVICESYVLFSSCSPNNLVPINPVGFQYPKSGNALIGCTILNVTGKISYLKNILKKPLEAGETYCLRYFANLSNNSGYGIDGLDIYFGNLLLDTFATFPCTATVNFLNPQISQPANQFVSDTLNWTALQGTYTATGGETYFLLANLRGIANTNSVLVNPGQTGIGGVDVNFDDFSLVPIDLPAYAGPDKTCIVGDSVYIGREMDVGTDYACEWFQLPNTSISLTGVSGMWVKPVATSTYVVKQQLWCSGIRYDTVVVYKDQVGLQELDLSAAKIYPIPSHEQLMIEWQKPISTATKLQVLNALGEIVLEQTLKISEQQTNIDLSTLTAGLYYLKTDSHSGSMRRKIIVD